MGKIIQIIRNKLLKIGISKHLPVIKEVLHLCPIGGQGATLSLFPHWVKYKQSISCTLSWVGLHRIFHDLTRYGVETNLLLLFSIIWIYLARNTGEHIILPCEHWYLVLDSLPFRKETLWETLIILLWYNEQ